MVSSFSFPNEIARANFEGKCVPGKAMILSGCLQVDGWPKNVSKYGKIFGKTRISSLV